MKKMIIEIKKHQLELCQYEKKKQTFVQYSNFLRATSCRSNSRDVVTRTDSRNINNLKYNSGQCPSHVTPRV